MLEFMSKALLALVLDKDAREKIDAAKTAAKNPVASPSKPKAIPAGPASRSASGAAPAMTDARRELIQKALDVQRSKQHVFDDLSDDAKAKILIAAVKAFKIPPDEIERSLARKTPRPRDKS